MGSRRRRGFKAWLFSKSGGEFGAATDEIVIIVTSLNNARMMMYSGLMVWPQNQARIDRNSTIWIVAEIR